MWTDAHLTVPGFNVNFLCRPVLHHPKASPGLLCPLLISVSLGAGCLYNKAGLLERYGRRELVEEGQSRNPSVKLVRVDVPFAIELEPF